jgi:uncharacterized protein with GYD domain
MGGRFVSFLMTTGEYDMVFVYEVPNDAVAARFALLLGQLGSLRTKPLKALPEQACRAVVASL